MNIGQLAAKSGVNAKTIRYYEESGLLPPARRGSNGYRMYGDRDVQVLRFVRRARNLGFSVEDVGALLALWTDRDRASADVKKLARAHIEEVDQRIAELESIRNTLADLMEHCHGDHRPDCPVLDALAGESTNQHTEKE